MYSDFYDTNLVSYSKYSVDSTWLVVSAVLALIGGIVFYILFVSTKNNGQYKGFVSWLHKFLNFKKLFINVVLKVLYMVTAIFITLSSFSFIRVSVASFFLWLILGNIVARISYEFILMLLTIVTNTTEINDKLSVLNSSDVKDDSKKKKSEKKSSEVVSEKSKKVEKTVKEVDEEDVYDDDDDEDEDYE